MPREVVIIGAGMGALTAAIRLARCGCQVTVLVASGQPGGLAANAVFDKFPFDAGPYVLLTDRVWNGLFVSWEWSWLTQTLATAPSPLALVPAVIHQMGAYYPTGGIGAIPAAPFERQESWV